MFTSLASLKKYTWELLCHVYQPDLSQEVYMGAVMPCLPAWPLSRSIHGSCYAMFISMASYKKYTWELLCHVYQPRFSQEVYMGAVMPCLPVWPLKKYTWELLCHVYQSGLSQEVYMGAGMPCLPVWPLKKYTL